MQNLLATRQGLSTLIASISVMAFSIALAIGIGHAVKSTLTISLAPAAVCTQLQIDPPLSIIRAEYLPESESMFLTLSRSFSTLSLSEFRVKMSSLSGEKREWSCNEPCGCALPRPGETKTYTIADTASTFSRIALEIGSCIVDSQPLSERS